MSKRKSDKWYVYALRLRFSDEYRYVGLTTGTVEGRLYEHKLDADRGKKRPVHDWIRKHPTEVVADVLVVLTNGKLQELEFVESFWIATFREQYQNGIKNKPILNVTDGGHTTLGMVYTDERREKKRQQMTGAGNHQYGRRGELAACYGRTGKKHPMYGKHHTPEVVAKISASMKGRKDKPETTERRKIAQHIRWHVNTSKPSTKCALCAADRGTTNDNMERAVPPNDGAR